MDGWDMDMIGSGDLPVEELGLGVLGAVETHVLGADEVLASRGVGRDLELELGHAVGAPGILGQIAALVAKDLLPDLEPIAVAFGLLDVVGSLGHVRMQKKYRSASHSAPQSDLSRVLTDLARSRVGNAAIVEKLHGDSVTSGDNGDLGVGSVGERSEVATEVGVIGG